MIDNDKQDAVPKAQQAMRVIIRYKNPYQRFGEGLHRTSSNPKERHLFDKVKSRRCKCVHKICAGKPQELAQRFGATNIRSFNHTAAIACEMTPDACARVRLDQDIEAVEIDGIAEIAQAQVVPYGIDLIKARAVQGSGVTGKGVNVAVLDTGVDIDHPDLIANIKGGVDFTDKGTYDDGHYHGTHVSGIIAAADNQIGVVGVAPSANLYAVKVLNDFGQGAFSWVIAGVEWCIDNDIDVISMSFGGSQAPSEFQGTLNLAYAQGIVNVAAAGNNGPGSSAFYPAAYDSVIAVAAVDGIKEIAGFSSQGPWVEVSAPGVSVYSCDNNGGYRDASGTSMACPHVSGLVALMIEGDRTLSVDDIRSTLIGTAEDLGDPGWDEVYGWGLVDASRAVTPVVGQDQMFQAETRAGKPYEIAFTVGPDDESHLQGEAVAYAIEPWIFETIWASDQLMRASAEGYATEAWQFVTRLDDTWNVPTTIAALRPTSWTFKTIFTSQDLIAGAPVLKLFRPGVYTRDILTVPVDRIAAGGQATITLELWYGRNQAGLVADQVELIAQAFDATLRGGLEVLDEGWLRIGNTGQSLTQMFDTTILQLGAMDPNTFVLLDFRVVVPTTTDSTGPTFFGVVVRHLRNVYYGTDQFGLARYVQKVVAQTEPVVFRMMVL